MMKDFIIINIKMLVGIHEFAPAKPLRKENLNTLNSLENAWVAVKNGIIAEYGNYDIPNHFQNLEIIDAKGGMVLPGFIDSHTHIVFAATRESEFVDRIAGLSYEEIAANGGGILNSAKKIETTTEDELFKMALERLSSCIAMGTCAIEIKSGYGLTVENELKMLRVIKRLKSISPIPIKATFLGAHAYPLKYKDNHQGYIDLIIDGMMPYIHRDELADYIDVFCDRGFFSQDETRQLLEAARVFDLKAKIHGNELGLTGGVQVAVSENAISVDHLEHIGQEECDLLSHSDTIATMLPGTAFFLGIPYPNARMLIDTGAAVCLASDYNPGSSPSGRMSFILSLACIKMKMTPAEAINAATINAAFALELQDQLGSITKGKMGKFIITKPIPSVDFIPYNFGGDLISKVIV